MSDDDGGRKTIRERIQESNADRRLLLLLLVFLLMLVGSGIGSMIFSSPSPPPAENESTPTATPSQPPASPTATAVPGQSGPPTATDTPTPTPTRTDRSRTPSDPSTETPRRSPDDRFDGGSQTPSQGLEFGDDQPLFSAEGIVPGQSGHGNLTVRNVAGEDGRLTISAVDAIDEENGITEPESSVDDTDRGELSKHLEVRFAIRDGGNEEYLVGSDAEYVPLANLTSEVSSSEYHLGEGEAVTLVADWRVPPETGNEVQSDGVAVDVGLTLESTGS